MIPTVPLEHADFPDRTCQCGETIQVWGDYIFRLKCRSVQIGWPQTHVEWIWAIGPTLAAVRYECRHRRWWNFWKHDKGETWRPRPEGELVGQ